MKEVIAVIAVDEETETELFYSWLAKHKNKIEAISENDGCGCCIDMYHILLKEELNVPCESSGTFEAKNLLYGEDKDNLIDFLTEEN